MSVAIFVTSESEAACLIPWGVRFARSQITELLIVCPKRSKGKESFDHLQEPDEKSSALHVMISKELAELNCDDVVMRHDVTAGTESSDHDRVMISIAEIVAPDPESSFVQHVPKLGVQLLVLPAFEPVKSSKGTVEWEERLFNSAPCGVVCVRGMIDPAPTPLTLMFASESDEDNDDEFALDQTARLGRSSRGQVTLLYVRPADDLVAGHVAERHLDRLERSIKNRKLQIDKRTELADSFHEGINQVDLSEYHLIVVGTRSARVIRQLLANLKGDRDEKQVPLAIMRQAVPMTDRLWNRFTIWVRSRVPQITREHRVNLVDRLTSSSNFDFDFIALISISTLIAALGLIQNSVAVVIGAMLVAPLMTPLVAIGLALVQGNIRLLKTALVSVFCGFSVALLIGVVVGLSIRLTMADYQMGDQLTSRGAPGLLDLIVALASGVAAAYAMGRPHLLSALPGVAIAAALVPPIATSGVAFSLSQWQTSFGALQLFFTNIVAIVLGTAITFWAVGISTHVDPADGQKRPARHWPRYWFVGFVVLSILLAVEFFYFPMSQPKEDRSEEMSPTKIRLPEGDVDVPLTPRRSGTESKSIIDRSD